MGMQTVFVDHLCEKARGHTRGHDGWGLSFRLPQDVEGKTRLLQLKLVWSVAGSLYIPTHLTKPGLTKGVTAVRAIPKYETLRQEYTEVLNR